MPKSIALTWTAVSHKPQWERADLPINAAGDTEPGFRCVHELENGQGQCGGTIFDLRDGFGDHRYIVHDPYPEMAKLAEYSTDEIDQFMDLLVWLTEHHYLKTLPSYLTHADLLHRYLGIDHVKLTQERALWRQRMIQESPPLGEDLTID